MTPAAILGVVVGVLGFAVTLSAILVSLGRVLQRQEHAELAAKALAEEVVALKATVRQLERDIQATTARLDGLGADHQRGNEKVSELRTQFSETLRTITSLREDLVDRLARIESYVEHHSTPPPQPGAGFGPPRRPTHPGEPR